MDKINVVNRELPDGRIYTGECIKHFGSIEFKGQGEMKYPNGDKYVGMFDGGFERGYGKYMFYDGDVHYGWFNDGIPPSGTGFLDKKTTSTKCLGSFYNGLPNGWAIRMVNGRPPQFGWWEDGTLVKNMTNAFMWIFEKIRDETKGDMIQIYDNGMFGFGKPQGDCDTFYGFLFDKEGTVSLGNAWNFNKDHHCAIFKNDGSLVFDEYNDGEFVKHSSPEDILWNFRLRVEE